MGESWRELRALDRAVDRLLASDEPRDTSAAALINDYASAFKKVEKLDLRLARSLTSVAILLHRYFPTSAGTVDDCLAVATDVLQHAWDPASAMVLETLLKKHVAAGRGDFVGDRETPAHFEPPREALRTALDHVRQLCRSQRPSTGNLASGSGGVAYSLPSRSESALSQLSAALDRIRSAATRRRRQDSACSVFAPDRAAPNSTILVQVWLHEERARARVGDAAEGVDVSAKLRGSTELLSFGDDFVIVRIHVPAGCIGQPPQQILKASASSPATFSLTIGIDFVGPLVCRISLSRVGKYAEVPFASLSFTISVEATYRGLPVIPDVPTQQPKRYQTAFVSYARNDLAEVIKHVQVLQALGVEFFQDFLSIRPGQAWSKVIYENIDRSDLFLLFWSSAAAKSEWVRREIRWAVEAHQASRGKSPDIIPIVIEAPSAPEPPPELEHLQFADSLLYFLPARESAKVDERGYIHCPCGRETPYFGRYWDGVQHTTCGRMLDLEREERRYSG
jgi:hypothetical protein